MMIARLKEIYHKRALLNSLVLKNLKNKYIGTALGFGWSVINPILLAIVIGFVFTSIFKTEKPNFTCFVLSGMLPWFFFASSISESAASILSGSSILNQFPVPREMFPVSAVYSNFMIFLTGLGILMPFFIIVNTQIVSTLVYLPLLLSLYFLFTLSLSLLTASINIIFRDLAHILNIGLMLWMWVTPIFYSMDDVPAAYRNSISMNPAAPFIYLFHALLYDNKVLIGPYFAWTAIMVFFLFFISYFIFLKLENKFVKRM